jgi:hypothetical protein
MVACCGQPIIHDVSEDSVLGAGVVRSPVAASVRCVRPSADWGLPDGTLSADWDPPDGTLSADWGPPDAPLLAGWGPPDAPLLADRDPADAMLSAG